jgi:hypothetical protein
MSKKTSVSEPELIDEVLPQYAEEDVLDDEVFDDQEDFLDEQGQAFDQDSLNFDKDARWELEEDESIKEIMRQISNKVNKKGQKDIYCWFRVQFIKSYALSNLDDTIINMYVMDAANTFNREALMKMSDWDLKSYDLPTLSLWIRQTIHIYLRRSYKDGERKHRTSRYGGINDQTEYGEHTKSDFSLGDILPGKKESRKPERHAQDIHSDTEFI